MNFSAGDADNQEDDGQQEASNGSTDEYQQGQGIWNMNRIKKKYMCTIVINCINCELMSRYLYK